MHTEQPGTESSADHLAIHQPHQFMTAFSVNGRTNYFAHTPFGLSSALSSLGKVLEKALKNVSRSFCLYYMDDLLIYSKSARAHFQHVKIVLQALLDAGLKINLLKCSFFQTQLQFLQPIFRTKPPRLHVHPAEVAQHQQAVFGDQLVRRIQVRLQ